MDSVISTPAAGYFRSDVALLDEVSAGQRLGTVRDPFGEVLAEITTENAGVVYYVCDVFIVFMSAITWLMWTGCLSN